MQARTLDWYPQTGTLMRLCDVQLPAAARCCGETGTVVMTMTIASMTVMTTVLSTALAQCMCGCLPDLQHCFTPLFIRAAAEALL